MAYLIINETLETMGSQLLHVIPNLFGDKFEQKKKYFESMFDIKKASPMICKLIKSQMNDALVLNPQKLNGVFNTRVKVTDIVYISYNNGVTVPVPITYNMTKKEMLHKDATDQASKNRFSHATTYYPVSCGGQNFYLCYFTFDTDGIEDASVLCKNTYGKGKIELRNLRGIKNIPVDLYKKY